MILLELWELWTGRTGRTGFLDIESGYIDNVLAFATDSAPHLIFLLAGFAAQHPTLMHAFPEGLLGQGEWGLLAIS